MDESIVGQVVPVGQSDALLLTPKLLHVLFRYLRIEVLHDVAPSLVKLVAWLSYKAVVL